MSKNWILLWFDVEIERITTTEGEQYIHALLWFDVEIERITTYKFAHEQVICCGLMQKQKELQPIATF